MGRKGNRCLSGKGKPEGLADMMVRGVRDAVSHAHKMSLVRGFRGCEEEVESNAYLPSST